ncbi:histidine phosphatase family protein, partial [Streptomyces sp. NPDC059956]|uniref:histidine phosphatase family protein n=1 Tax=Streptomyces sp. NPDC059956 TaxID=3347015 RepID=UPI00365311E1
MSSRRRRASGGEGSRAPRPHGPFYGRRQAVLLGERLRGAPLTAIHHGPLARAEQTAQLVREQLDDVPLRRSGQAGDYIPYMPQREELPSESADAMLGHLAQF